MIKGNQKAYVLAFIAVIFWSTAATAFKLTLIHMTPEGILFIASSASALVMFIIVLLKGHFLSLFDRKYLMRSLLAGAINPFFYYLILFKAYDMLPAQTALVLNYTWPMVIALLSIPFLKQKLPFRTLIALTAGLIGVGTVVGGISFTGGFKPVLLLPILSSVFWGVYWMLNIRDKRPDSVKLFMGFFMGSILSLLYLLFSGGMKGFTLPGILGSCYIGIFEMGLAFFIWLKALKTADRTSRVSSVVYLAPLISLLIINTVLGERIKSYTLIGLLLIVGGILLDSKVCSDS
ncbi:DMT family transporter [bacterium]|nr:DMT family transporter [bacterium]